MRVRQFQSQRHEIVKILIQNANDSDNTNKINLFLVKTY